MSQLPPHSPTMRHKYSVRPFFATLLTLSLLAILSFVAQSDFFSQAGQAPWVSQTLQRRDRGHEPEQNGKCILVHEAKDQCAFIKANCPDEEAGVFSYLTLYYCLLPSIKPLGFTIIAAWLGLLFATIGIAASDFLCVNLSTIAAILGMSESFTGVTFLAFGNGSPDVFSTLAAMKSHSGSLAIGELIGAASFISAVVAGSMAVIRPFKVMKRTFVREVGFFIVAVAFSMVFLANGKLELWESAVMVAFYIFYVVTVMIWHWWEGQRRRRREREAAARAHYVIPGHDDVHDEYHDEQDHDGDERSIGASTRSSHTISAHDLRDLEEQGSDIERFPDFVDEDDEEARDRMMGELSSNMRLRRPRRGSRRNTTTPIRPSLLGAIEFQTVLHSLSRSRNLLATPINLRRYSDDLHHAISNNLGAHPSGSVSAQPKSDPLGPSDAEAGNRARAVSTNDVTRLLSPPLRSSIPEIDLLSASPPEIGAQTLATSQPPTPLVSVTGDGSEEAITDASPLIPPMQGQDYLSPVLPKQKRYPNLTYPPASGPISRPQLTVTPPEPGPFPHRSTAPPSHTHSPLLDFPQSLSPNAIPSLILPSPDFDEQDGYFNGEAGTHEGAKPLSWWPYKYLPSPYRVFATLFPTLSSWRDRSWWARCIAVISAPPIFFLTITIPIVEADDDHETEKHVRQGDEAATPTAAGPARGQNGASTTTHHHHHHDHSSTDADPALIAMGEATALQTPAREWNRWLLMIQCFTAPFFIVLNFWANMDPTPRALIVPTLYSLLASFILLFILLLTTTPSSPPRIRIIACLLGFAVSMTWVSAIAGEVVGALKTIGVILRISDAILGLTVFAVGNSINDLVADVTVARLGFPVMALTACFAGPMLNILLGIGIGGLWMTIHGAKKKHLKHPDEPVHYKPYHIDVSYTLLISAIALLITLVSLLIAVPASGWRMTRRLGWGLIALWCVATIVNVVVESTGWDGDVA